MISIRNEQYRYVSIDSKDQLVHYDDTWEDTTIASTGDATKQTTATDGNSTATLEFRGISIYVFGWVLPRNDPTPVIECSVDGVSTSDGSPYRLPGLGQNFRNPTPMQLCSVEGLTDGDHKIQVTVRRATEDYPFQLDMFMFRLSPSQYKDLSDVLNAETSADATSSVPATSTSASPRGTTTASTPNSQGTSAAPIVGGVLGALAGLALTAFGIWVVLRRRKHKYFKLFDRSEPSDAEKVTPFLREPPLSRSLSQSSRHSSLRSLQLVDGGEPSVAAATYHPSPDVSEDQVPASQATRGDRTRTGEPAATPSRPMGKKMTAGFFSPFQRMRRGRMASESTSEYPSEAPPVYSPDATGEDVPAP
ncbi:hypothetical protein BV20DRAFT_962630 [Pilatotrama ljubarskyi]|nr:hypothetical protein BV20DRAFT_962630 [Pilatotrama ljubarskyi]